MTRTILDEIAAIASAIRQAKERWERAPCTNEAVSSCDRCNAIFLTKVAEATLMVLEVGDDTECCVVGEKT